jgi:hypothetical protein
MLSWDEMRKAAALQIRRRLTKATRSQQIAPDRPINFGFRVKKISTPRRQRKPAPLVDPREESVRRTLLL